MRKIILFLISLLILTACNNKVDDNVQGCDIFECADTNTTGEVMTFKENMNSSMVQSLMMKK